MCTDASVTSGLTCTQVDTTWRDLMEAAHSSPNVLVLAKNPEHLARLEEANKLLEEIQKVRCRHTLEVAGPSRIPGHTNTPMYSTLSSGLHRMHAQFWWCLTVSCVSAAAGPCCLPGAQAHRLPALFLPVKRRDAGDPERDQGPQAGAATPQEMLRGHLHAAVSAARACRLGSSA